MRDVQHQDMCRKCREMLPAGARFCACGVPTNLATFEERNKYEASQWRTYKSSQTA